MLAGSAMQAVAAVRLVQLLLTPCHSPPDPPTAHRSPALITRVLSIFSLVPLSSPLVCCVLCVAVVPALVALAVHCVHSSRSSVRPIVLFRAQLYFSSAQLCHSHAELAACGRAGSGAAGGVCYAGRYECARWPAGAGWCWLVLAGAGSADSASLLQASRPASHVYVRRRAAPSDRCAVLCAVCCVLCAVCCVCGAGVPVHAGAAVYESWQDVADSECEECDVAAAVSWVSWAMGSSGVVQQPDYGERESVHAAAAAATDAGSDLRPVFVDGSPQTFQNLDVVEDYDASVTAAMKNDSSAAFLICSISASSVFNKLDASQFPAWFTNYTTCLRWIGFASVGLRTGSNSSFTGSIQLAPVMIDVVRKLFR